MRILLMSSVSIIMDDIYAIIVKHKLHQRPWLIFVMLRDICFCLNRPFQTFFFKFVCIQ
jgi:hypothetical protein